MSKGSTCHRNRRSCGSAGGSPGVRVCVTGATGYVGAHVAARLAQRGDEVRVTVRDRRRLTALAGCDVEVFDADVLDRRSMRHALEGCDVLFHAAGMVASRPRRQVWRVNAVGPRVAVETAAHAACRAWWSPPASRRSARPGATARRPSAIRIPSRGRACSIQTRNTKASELPWPMASGWESMSCPCALLRAGPRVQPDAARRDLHPDRGQLPARPAAGDRRLVYERRRRRGRRGRAPAAPPSAGAPGERYIVGGENVRWSEVIEGSRASRGSGTRCWCCRPRSRALPTR